MSDQSYNPAPEVSGPRPFDLLRVPGVGAALRWRHARTILQIPLLLLGVVMILQGLLGPQLAPKNLATSLTWIHFRGALVLVILCAGNFFCLACPFMLVRNAARRFARPWLNWPRKLRNKWLSAGLFIFVLFAYELFHLWSSPLGTACLIAAYFIAVLVVDTVFKHASFCKFVCPLGQFNFMASLLSPLEIKVRDRQVCTGCSTRDCIRGRRVGAELVIIQRGCELALFQPLKMGNMDCTFCLDCVHACPHDNVGILARLPASELEVETARSGIGSFARRPDLAVLAVIFTFGALVNAFGMVSPVYVLEQWLAHAFHVNYKAPALGAIFATFLFIEPMVFLGSAAWVARTWLGSRRALIPFMVRYSFALVPLGFGMWLSHYCFHFLTGLLTFVPVTQNAARSLGWTFLGEPRWTWSGIPARFVQPAELGFLALGFVGSLLVTRRLAEEDSFSHPMRAFIPWAVVCLLIFLAMVWLMFQPMEMRATFMISLASL